MATTHTSSLDEKASGAEHLESIQLEDGKHDIQNDNVKREPIYGIDEAHQKRVMYVDYPILISRATAANENPELVGALTFVFFPSSV